jgi:phosphotriesterase-related protein
MTAGQVVTINGPVDPESIGFTLSHEHFVVHADNWFVRPESEEEAAFAYSPLDLTNLARVRYRPFSHWDNIRLDDVETIIAEVNAYLDAGGRTIVDVTPPAIGRDPSTLLDVARRTGVRVVCGAGYYVASAHPAELATMSEADIAEGLVAEFTSGIGTSGIRPGVIGEIGTSNPLHPVEAKVFRASAMAQRRTGAPVSIHMSSPANYAHDVLDILEEGGADLSKVAIGHLDEVHKFPVEYHSSIAARGAYVEYDLFGPVEFSEDGLWPPPPSDLSRIDAITQLIEMGIGDRLLLSHDVCTKIQQRAYGGFGFAHLPGHVLPLMRRLGLQEDQLNMLTQTNPARWLTWGRPAES